MRLYTAKNELAPDVFRLTIAPNDHFEFSQFLLVDKNPCLIHAGKSTLFGPLKEIVQSILEGRSLKYIVFSHVEADESGAANKWLNEYPDAQVVCNKIANISLDDSLIRPAKILRDGDTIELGTKQLKMVETPHFPQIGMLICGLKKKTTSCSALTFVVKEGSANQLLKQTFLNQLSSFMKKVGSFHMELLRI